MPSLYNFVAKWKEPRIDNLRGDNLDVRRPTSEPILKVISFLMLTVTHFEILLTATYFEITHS